MKKYLKLARKVFFISNLLAIVNVLMEAIYPLLLSYVIDNFSNLTCFNIISILLIFVFSIIFLLVIVYLNKITRAKYNRIVCNEMRKDLFKSFINMKSDVFYKEKNERYSSFLINDIDDIYTLYFENRIYLINSLFMLVTYTIVLAFISWKMCIVIICSLGIILFIPRLVGNKFETMNNSLSTSKANYLSKCEELFLAHDLINNKNIDAIEERCLSR